LNSPRLCFTPRRQAANSSFSSDAWVKIPDLRVTHHNIAANNRYIYYATWNWKYATISLIEPSYGLQERRWACNWASFIYFFCQEWDAFRWYTFIYLISPAFHYKIY
jgi:hypothetical protein